MLLVFIYSANAMVEKRQFNLFMKAAAKFYHDDPSNNNINRKKNSHYNNNVRKMSENCIER